MQDISGQTGEQCTIEGAYKCAVHPENIIYLRIGDHFPMCRKHSTRWILLFEH